MVLGENKTKQNRNPKVDKPKKTNKPAIRY